MSKRVIIVANNSSNLLNFRGHLIKNLVDKKFEVLVLIPKKDFSIKFEKKIQLLGANASGIPLERAGMNPFYDLMTFFSLKSIFKKFKPNIVLSYTSKPIIYSGLVIAKSNKINFFPNLTGLGYGFTDKFEFKRILINFLLKILYKHSLKSSTAIIFQNQDDEFLFKSLNLTSGKKTFIVNGSGVDLNFFSPTNLPKKPIFLMLSRLVADKGVVEYCEAAREIRTRFPDAKFQLAGSFDTNPSGLKYDKLKKYIDNKDIEYLGYVDDVRELLNKCKFYVLPSYREGTPRSVLEAMSIGRPIITTNTTGCRETVVHGTNGLLVPIKDKVALTEAIKTMLEFDDDKINEMAKESIKIVREKYDVSKVNQNIINIIEYKSSYAE